MADIRHPNGAWYIDPDDGTIIYLFDVVTTTPLAATIFFDRTLGTRCPPPAIYFIQSNNPRDIGSMEPVVYGTMTCGIATRHRPTKQLTVSPSLPADFCFNSGKLLQFEDRLSLFLEEFTPSRVGLDTVLIGGNTDYSVRTFITRYDFINHITLGTSSGSPSQTFTASEFDTPTLGAPTVRVDGQVWSQVIGFDGSGPDSTVYIYDSSTATVEFGDGIQGQIPAEGAEIKLRISVRNGGGTWSFAGITVDQQPEYNLAIMGALEDRILYARALIAVADIGKFTNSVTTLNGIRTEYYRNVPHNSNNAVLESTGTLYHKNEGGTLVGSGGDTVLLNCTTGTLTNYPSFSKPLNSGTTVVVETANIVVAESEMQESTFLGGFRSVAVTDYIVSTAGCEIGPPTSQDVVQFVLDQTYESAFRDARIIQVGDVFGTFDSPVVTGAYNGGTSVVIISPSLFGHSIDFQKTGTSSLGIVKVVVESRLKPFFKELADDLGLSVDLDDFTIDYDFMPGDIIVDITGLGGCV